MSARIDSMKAVKQVDAKISEIDAKIDGHEARMLAAAMAQRNAVEGWRARATAAFDQGVVFDEFQPAVSEAQRLAGDFLAGLRRDREGLLRERSQAIADGGPEVLEAAGKAVMKAVEQARPMLAELDKVLRVLKDAQTDVLAVTDCLNAVSTKGIMKAPDTRPIDLKRLATAVATGTDPLEVETSHAERVLGWQMEVKHADGSVGVVTMPSSEDSHEYRQRRDAALAEQARQLRGGKAARPLGYRSGMI